MKATINYFGQTYFVTFHVPNDARLDRMFGSLDSAMQYVRMCGGQPVLAF